MEKAVWNGKSLLASEVADNYLLEKEIRKASGRKELRCTDPNCQCNVVKYCHGEIKDAFFAHINNKHCDYATFDSENNQVMRSIRKRIFDNFRSRGYQVQTEIKLLNHHYTHLLFDFPKSERIAVEIGTQRISANRIDSLTKQYRAIGVPVKWIVLGDTGKPVRENQTFFIKRYALNESACHDLMVVDWDCRNAAQYRMDPNTYEYHGTIFSSDNYPEVYTEYGSLDDLVFESGEITFAGFHERFDMWLGKKKRAFDKKIQQMEVLSQQKMKEAGERKKRVAEFRKHTESITRIEQPKLTALKTDSICDSDQTLQKSYEERRQEILSLIDSEDIQTKDSAGKRWLKCSICGSVDTADKFVLYGGDGKGINTGLCKNCSKNEQNK